MKFKSLNRFIILTGVVGILVSTYALYVEMSAEVHPGYEALCDLAEFASCTRVLTSEYSKGFGILPEEFALPNCIYGIVFYCLIILMSTFDYLLIVRLQLLLALLSAISCVYLGYLLAFVLHDFCIVCVSTYVVNFSLVLLINRKKNLLCIKNK